MPWVERAGGTIDLPGIRLDLSGVDPAHSGAWAATSSSSAVTPTATSAGRTPPRTASPTPASTTCSTSTSGAPRPPGQLVHRPGGQLRLHRVRRGRHRGAATRAGRRTPNYSNSTRVQWSPVPRVEPGRDQRHDLRLQHEPPPRGPRSAASSWISDNTKGGNQHGPALLHRGVLGRQPDGQQRRHPQGDVHRLGDCLPSKQGPGGLAGRGEAAGRTPPRSTTGGPRPCSVHRRLRPLRAAADLA